MKKPYRMNTRRKLAIATWSSPREGNIYGKLTIDATNALAYLQDLNQKTGIKTTITHLVGRATGLALKSAPDLNGRIVFGGYVPHETVDLAFLVALPHNQDLAKFKVCNIDQKTTTQIAQELHDGSERLRAGKDANFEKSKSLLNILPTWLIRPLLWLTGYVTGALGYEVKALGLEAFPFGAAIITSVGMLGIDEGYAPPTPFARVPVYLAITQIKQRVVVYEGEIAIRPQLDIMATVDHRFMDGYQGGMLVRKLKQYLENPETMDASPEQTSAALLDSLTNFPALA
ncbi:MAG: 2-oxo acid dehydrogenase subunit E2 [Myxococcaceae bacterium]